MKKTIIALIVILMLTLCGCSHTHTYTQTDVPPTCTEDGYTQYTCECGEEYQDNKRPAAHTEQVLPGKDATCTEDGLTEGKQCSACKVLLSEQQVIPATGHAYGDWVVAKESTLTEQGTKEKICSLCNDTITQSLPLLDDPDAEEYTVTYDLDGGHFSGGYTSIEQLAEEFLADFNTYGDGTNVTKENFQTESHPCVKTSLANAEMLTKWSWLWVYMLEHLQSTNPDLTGDDHSEYLTDTYPILRRMIGGDTDAIQESANARTTIRSYIHGLLNAMKGCGNENIDFSIYSPDFSQQAEREKILQQRSTTATLPNGAKLPIPTKEGCEFIGWKNKYEKIIDKASCNGTLVALWKELNPVEKIEITNKITELELNDSYQLKWKISPSDAPNNNVIFESSNKAVASIDENGTVTAHKTGTVTLKITSLSQHGHTDTMTLNIVTPTYFDISYETNSYVIIGETIKLNATYIDSKGKACEVDWKSLDESLATVDENGCVTGKAQGVVKIRATAKGHADQYQDFVVTVLTQNINKGLRLVLDAHESNIFIKYDLAVGSGKPSYYKDIFGSVSKLLYNRELEIDDTYNQKSNEKYGSNLPGRTMSSIEFITVHYTGNFDAGADAEAHGDWFSLPTSENNTSIHYSTGNDGIYKGLDEQYRAAHAGDNGSRDTVLQFSWIDTPVEVLDTDPEIPVVTITSNATYAINGRDTGVKVPQETKFGRGYVTQNKWLNDMGIGVNVSDGKYQIGTSWWCYTQVSEGRICSNGGNYNSIGIESAVNRGSDLWYTWQITAQLVADIMERHELDITKVKGHHFFTAKNCPQPLLENDLEIWHEFIELVKVEYEKITSCYNYTFAFESNSELVNEHGRVIKQRNEPQVVTYTVSITKNGKTETVELASIIDGIYNK